MKSDFHIHSKYSYDSVMEPSCILRLCKKMGYDVISITDHDSMTGSLEAKKHEKDFGIRVICGEERLTDAGDIVGLDLNGGIKSKNWVDVFDEIKSQGAKSILVHPYRAHKNTEQLAFRADLIEIWNSRSKPLDNIRAIELATRLGKPTVVGSDAHLYTEIGNVAMTMKGISDFQKEFKVRYCKKYEKIISYIIGRARLGFC